MKVEETKERSMDLGFQTVEPGTYLWQINEGVDLLVKDDSESQSLKIPMVVDQAVDGDENAAGQSGTLFINLITKEGKPNTFGEKQINLLLTITGLAPKFASRFPEEIEPTDKQFVDALRLKLPGNFVKLTHEVKKGDRGEFMNFTKVEESGGKKTTGTKPKPEPANEDW
jgi:hypothetical protein